MFHYGPTCQNISTNWIPQYVGWLGANYSFFGFAEKSEKYGPAMPKIWKKTLKHTSFII
jgi:hypothetical protein